LSSTTLIKQRGLNLVASGQCGRANSGELSRRRNKAFLFHGRPRISPIIWLPWELWPASPKTMIHFDSRRKVIGFPDGITEPMFTSPSEAS
jgi:hypothetical protein